MQPEPGTRRRGRIIVVQSARRRNSPELTLGRVRARQEFFYHREGGGNPIDDGDAVGHRFGIVDEYCTIKQIDEPFRGVPRPAFDRDSTDSARWNPASHVGRSGGPLASADPRLQSMRQSRPAYPRIGWGRRFALMTYDLPAVIREFGTLQKIFFVHFRDVRSHAGDFVEPSRGQSNRHGGMLARL
jgi:hypothetical protein